MISSRDYGQLIGLGLGMGFIHVLSGPDHLSALATLSVGGHWRAFYLGIRWGLGHSTGLVLIAIILLSVGDKIDMKSLESYCDWIVGAFMLALGAYGVFKAFKDEQSRRRKHLDTSNSKIELAKANGSATRGRDDCAGEDGASLTAGGPEDGVTHQDSMRPACEDAQPGVGVANGEVRPTEGLLYDDEDLEAAKRCVCLRWCRAENTAMIKVVAFCIGVVHGIAGPGGVLGVLPAVHLHNNLSASLYLASFCITSTLCMGIFAALYGELTGRVSSAKQGKIQFCLGLFSASLSLAVGVVWITLTALGILGKVFD